MQKNQDMEQISGQLLNFKEFQDQAEVFIRLLALEGDIKGSNAPAHSAVIVDHLLVGIMKDIQQ